MSSCQSAKEADMQESKQEKRRPYERVNHFEAEAHAVDVAVERRLPLRALRERISKETKRLRKALGPRSEIWAALEESLNELHQTREEQYFDLGFEHGFAAGRADSMQNTADTWRLAALLRDTAIQDHCPRERAVAALLEAAWSLVGSKTPRKKARTCP
jgi:flagellar biosynthesis/type III secretory pathway protein FliH